MNDAYFIKSIVNDNVPDNVLDNLSMLKRCLYYYFDWTSHTEFRRCVPNPILVSSSFVFQAKLQSMDKRSEQ